MVSGLLVTSGFGGVGWELEVVISYCLEGFFSQLVDVPFSCLLDLVDGLEKVGLVAPFSNFLNGGEFLTVVFVVCRFWGLSMFMILVVNSFLVRL